MIIKDNVGVSEMVGPLRRSNFIALDLETTGFDPYSERLVMLQLWDGEGEVYVLDCRGCKNLRALGKTLAPVLDEAQVIVGHNLKFDLQWIKLQLGINLNNMRLHDTMIAEQYIKGLGLSDAMKHNISFSLKDTAKRHEAGDLSKEERNWFISLNSRGDEWAAPFPQEQIEYAERDVRVLRPIYEAQKRVLEARGMSQAMEDEMGALIALVEAELNGINIDVEAWRAFIEEKRQEAEGYYTQVIDVFGPAIQEARLKRFDEEMEVYRAWEERKAAYLDLIKKSWEFAQSMDPWPDSDPLPKWLEDDGIYEGWGAIKNRKMKAWRELNPSPGKPKLSTEPPNLGSPVQLLDALHALGIEVKSAGVEVLEPLKDQHPEVGLLLQWRKSVKFVQSFGETLLDKINPTTGRIHPTFHQIGASSGRMSSSNPNFQQVPSKGDGAKLRACVVAPPGSKLIIADYSAQELRILADQSGDKRMLAFFEDEGVDLHKETAKVMFGLEEVDKASRNAAKTLNYGIVYGMSAYALAMRLKIEPDRGEELMEAWFNTYPEVRGWLKKRAAYTKRTLTSPTETGWVRRFPPTSHEPTMPQRGAGSDEWTIYHHRLKEYKQHQRRLERQGMNTPIQGTAAGITKKALYYLVRGLDSNPEGCYNRAVDYSSTNTQSKFSILVVVHDEVVLEAAEEHAEAAAEYLADCMDRACRDVLKRVHIPRTEVNVSDYWSH